DDSLATMLLRKADWHDYQGVRWLLEHGADANRTTPWGNTALHHAVLRDNALAIIEEMLDHGADPTVVCQRSPGNRAGGVSAVSVAARRGRGDLLELFERRGVPIQLHGVERLIAACASIRTGRTGARPSPLRLSSAPAHP